MTEEAAPSRRPQEVDPLAYSLTFIARHWPEMDRSAVWATGQLLRVADLIRSQLDDAVRDTGVTFARLELLLMLYYARNRELTLSRISERLMIHRSSVTGAIDRLVDLGLVERTRSEEDRRTVFAKLTPAGEEAVVASVPPVIEVRSGLAGLTRDETLQLAALLSKLRRLHGDEVGEPDV